MQIVDTALAQRHAEKNPVRVAISGAGYMGRGVVRQILTGVRGMTVSAIANRTVAGAVRAYREAGVEDVVTAGTVAEVEGAVAAGRPCVAEDASLLARASGLEVFVETTGEIEYGARVVVDAIEHGRHVVLLNAELDATIGPLLKRRADRAGVVFTDTDGDEPGVAMNLVRFVNTVGYRAVAAGNIKGMLDHYRTPETQRAFAEKHGQKPRLITTFADGSKLAIEMTVLANATGFRVGKRGAYGPACKDVTEITRALPAEKMLSGGLVDYALGAAPGTGAWVVAYCDDPVKQQYLRYFKLGDGPFYCFYTPYHLPHVQIVTTIARAALFRDATVAPAGAPVCGVIAVAKRDLRAGETLDGIGGFTSYGLIDNTEALRDEGLLPIGQSEGCRVRIDIRKDTPIRLADVDLPPGRLLDRLLEEQGAVFAHAGRA